LQQFVSVDRVRECILGTPLDVAKLSNDQMDRASVLMLHCALNGPVSVHKVTNFPCGLQGSIEGLVGVAMSNNTWSRTCHQFSTWLKSTMWPIVQDCQQVRMHGDLWPLHGKSGSTRSAQGVSTSA